MHIQFETKNLEDNDFPNKKIDGKRWYTRTQACLMFTDGSNYPDKFDLNIAFTDSNTERNAAAPFEIGTYQLMESAFGFDARRNPVVDFRKLRPFTKKTN